MTITRKSVADALDEYDSEISDLQDGKRDTLQDYRAQLAECGLGKDEIKVEIDAFKAALKRRRAIREKGEDTIDQKDALVDEIYVEISGRNARRATRVENIEESSSNPAFDKWLEEVADRVDPALLMQIIEGSKTAAGRAIIMAAIKVVKADRVDTNPVPPGGPQAEEAPSPQASSAEPISEIHESSSNNDEASSTAAPQGEAVHSQGTGAETLAGREERIEGQAASADLPTNSIAAVEKKPSRESHKLEIAGASPAPATISETQDGEPSETLGTAAEPTGAEDNDSAPARPTAADNALKLRPYCQHSDDLSKCAGQGHKHCFACQKAHAEAEGQSA